jgi:hypothetical protein
MAARFETLDENTAKTFYLQYRFPPCSVGEVIILLEALAGQCSSCPRMSLGWQSWSNQ